jgi:hypothetical protein
MNLNKASDKELALEIIARKGEPEKFSFFSQFDFSGKILLNKGEYQRLKDDLAKELSYKTKQYRHFQENPEKIRSPKHWQALERDREFVLNVLAFVKLADTMMEGFAEQAQMYLEHYSQASQVNQDMIDMAMKAVRRSQELKKDAQP